MQTTLNETNVRALLFSIKAPNHDPKLISDHNQRPATPKGKALAAKVAAQGAVRQGIDR